MVVVSTIQNQSASGTVVETITHVEAILESSYIVSTVIDDFIGIVCDSSDTNAQNM